MDMNELGDASTDGTPLNILSQQALIDVNQDELGRQIELIEEISTADVHFYKAVIANKGQSFMGVLIVNWGEAKPADPIMFDMVKAGVAITSNDVCDTYNLLNTTEVMHTGGGEIDFGVNNIEPHGVMMKKIWCAPFYSKKNNNG